MTINKHLPPIHIHPILIIFFIISFLTGTFLQLFIVIAIVLFHELGHYIAASFFKWRIKGIMLWIFGGVMETDEHGNRPFLEDFIVTIAGPVQHLFIYLLVYLNSFEQMQIISPPISDTVFFYNTMILIFNLLPIWPLDGGKISFLVLAKFFPYRKAHDIILIISMGVCLLFLILQFVLFSFNLSVFLITVFLLKENRLEWKRRYYVFIRFLLRRYQGESSVGKVSPLSVWHDMPLMEVLSQFYRDRKHSIYITYPDKPRVQLDENDCLRSYFYDKQVNVQIGDLKKHFI